MNILNLNAFQFEVTDLFVIHEIFKSPVTVVFKLFWSCILCGNVEQICIPLYILKSNIFFIMNLSSSK